MIDTIKLVKVLPSHLPIGQIKWQSFKTAANGITTGSLNPTAEDRRNGQYRPNITYYERPMFGGMRYEVGLEVSLPKLHFGNNFKELTESDYKAVAKDLKHSLRAVGFSKEFASDIGNFEVRKVDFCKNIRFEDGTLVITIINNLHRANISKVFDVQKTDFRNGGEIYHIHTNSEDIVFYDKIADLEQSAKSEHKSVDHTDNYCQRHLLTEIAARLKDEKERYNQQLLELTANDKTFELDASTLLWVAQHARQLFASLKVEQKTRFLTLLLSNLEIKQKTVLPSLLEPFKSLYELSKSLKTSNWLPGLDSNQ